MTSTPSISELAKAAELVKRLNDCAEWKMLRASDDPRSDEFDHAPFEAAEIILSLSSRVENAEAALKPKPIEEAVERLDEPQDYLGLDVNGDWSFIFKYKGGWRHAPMSGGRTFTHFFDLRNLSPPPAAQPGKETT